MRANLVARLDDPGIHAVLGIDTTAQSSDLRHSTSALTHAVSLNDRTTAATRRPPSSPSPRLSTTKCSPPS